MSTISPKSRADPKRVIAVAVTSRGFGFALMEGPDSLVDWGVTQPRPYRESQCVANLLRTIERYGPQVLVVEDSAVRPRSCSARVRGLHTRIQATAVSMELRTRVIPWSSVRQAFNPNGRIIKYGIARHIATLLPQLAPRLPRYRKPWMSEDYGMAIFEAVALGITYYQSLKRYRDFIRKHLPNS